MRDRDTLIATVLVPASSYNLVDLPTAKDELDISLGDTSNDTWLGRAIAQVSGAIANYCNRVLVVETVQDTFYGGHGHWPLFWPTHNHAEPSEDAKRLQLSRWPLIVPPVVLQTNADTPSGAVLPLADTTGVAVGQPAGHCNIAAGTVVVSIVTNTSVTLSAPITADIPSASMVSFGLSVTETPPLWGTPHQMTYGVDYIADANNGQLIRLLPPLSGAAGVWWPAIRRTVCYQAGYATIPDDLVDVTLRMVAGRWAAKGRDPLLRVQDQPGLGRREWWVGSAPSARGGLPDEIAGILDNGYRMPVVGDV